MRTHAEKLIQEDLDDGKFNQICSNETTFKNYIRIILVGEEAIIEAKLRQAIKQCHGGGNGRRLLEQLLEDI